MTRSLLSFGIDNLLRSSNNPKRDIERKLRVDPELFLIGVVDDKVVATAMGGYDGHRGWVNYLAIDPVYQRRGFGRLILEAVDGKLLAVCLPNVNLQIRADNIDVVKFYEAMGYDTE